MHAGDCARQAMDLMYRHGGSTSFKTGSRLAEVWRDLQVVGQAATIAPEWYPIGGRAFLGYALDYLPDADMAGWATAHMARHGLARRWSLWYQEYPVLLSPVWTQPAFPLDFDIASAEGAAATLELMRPVLPANLLGTPAAVVPAGMADGLPVGVQVMGGKYTELRCLSVAEAIEHRLGPLTPIDPVL